MANFAEQLCDMGMPYPLADEVIRGIASGTTAEKILPHGVSYPLAIELARQINSGSYNADWLVAVGLAPELASLIAGGTGIPLSTVLDGIVVYGQSRSNGQTDAGLTLPLSASVYPREALTFTGTANNDVRMGVNPATSTVVDPQTLTGLGPLVAKYGIGVTPRGQTPTESLTNRLVELAHARRDYHRHVAFTAGVGSTFLSELKDGTQPYANMLIGVQAQVTLATSLGCTCKIRGINMFHGENDSASLTYYFEQLDFYDTANTDIKAITGQSENIIIFLDQPSSFPTGQGLSGLAMVRLAKNFPDKFRLVGANFMHRFASDFLHHDPQGYNDDGKKFGTAYDNVFNGDASWTGVHLDEANITRNGATITAPVLTEVSPALLDDVTVSNPGNYGIGWSDTSGKTVSTVTLANDVLTVLLSGTPDVGGSLDVGMIGHSSNLNRTQATIPRNNIRDSSAQPIWAAHQRYDFRGPEILTKTNFDDDTYAPWVQAQGTLSTVTRPKSTRRYLRITKSGGTGRARYDFTGLVPGDYYEFMVFFERSTPQLQFAWTISASSTTGSVNELLPATTWYRKIVQVTQANQWIFLSAGTGADATYCDVYEPSFRKLI